VERLEIRGVHAEGRVGDADPLLAIADALPTFRADQIVISAEPEHSPRRTAELALRARTRFGLPTSTQDDDTQHTRKEAALAPTSTSTHAGSGRPYWPARSRQRRIG